MTEQEGKFDVMGRSEGEMTIVDVAEIAEINSRIEESEDFREEGFLGNGHAPGREALPYGLKHPFFGRRMSDALIEDEAFPQRTRPTRENP